MDGKDILRTLIELLEAQEQIKITYTIREREDKDECRVISSSEKCS